MPSTEAPKEEAKSAAEAPKEEVKPVVAKDNKTEESSEKKK